MVKGLGLEVLCVSLLLKKLSQEEGFATFAKDDQTLDLPHLFWKMLLVLFGVSVHCSYAVPGSLVLAAPPESAVR